MLIEFNPFQFFVQKICRWSDIPESFIPNQIIFGEKVIIKEEVLPVTHVGHDIDCPKERFWQKNFLQLFFKVWADPQKGVPLFPFRIYLLFCKRSMLRFLRRYISLPFRLDLN